MRIRCLAVLLTAVLVGCSSAPPAAQGVQERKNRAADYLKFGRQAFQEAQYDQALSFYLVALDLNTAVDHEVGMAAAWNAVASAHAALGRSSEARDALAQAERLAAASADRTVILQVAVSLVHQELASGQRSAARTRLEALKPFPSTAEGAALDYAWGMLEKDEDHASEALAAFDRALAINQNLGLKQEMASNRFMRASVLGKQGLWTQARSELMAALALDREVENTLGIGQDWRSLGTVALRLNEPQAAFDAYVRAARLFQAAGLTDQQRRTIELLLPVAATLGLTGEEARYRGILERLGSPSK